MSLPRVIGRIAAVFLMLLFVTVTPILIFAYDVHRAVINGQFLDELFEDPGLFEVATREIAEELPRELARDPETRDLPISRFSADDWGRLIGTIAPPDMLQQWMQEAVRDFRQWLRHGGDLPEEIIIPFGQIRDNVVNDPDQLVLRILAMSLPECGPTEDPLSGPETLVPRCRPPSLYLESFFQSMAGRWHDQSRQLWAELLPEEIARYPDDVSLAAITQDQASTQWWEGNLNWQATRWVLRLTNWLFAAVVIGQGVLALSLIALLAARDWREASRWVGTPLLLVGAATLLLGVAVLIGWNVGLAFVPPDEFVWSMDLFETVGQAFSDALWLPLAWQGGILFFIGMVLWILSFALPEREAAWAPAPAGQPAAPVPLPPEAPSYPAAASPVREAPPAESVWAEVPAPAPPETEPLPGELAEEPTELPEAEPAAEAAPPVASTAAHTAPGEDSTPEEAGGPPEEAFEGVESQAEDAATVEPAAADETSKADAPRQEDETPAALPDDSEQERG